MIKEIELTNFRCHKNIKIDVDKQFCALIGDNAIGKTSILEAIYFLSTTKSFRTNDYKELIMHNENCAKIVVLSENGSFRVLITKNGKKISKNGIEMKKTTDYYGSLPSIFFSPNELNIIYGSPQIRRKFINIEISQISKKYLTLISEYNNILTERNEFLHENELDEIYFKVINEKIIKLNLEIIKLREKFVDLINEKLKKIHSYFSNNEKIKIVYKKSVNKDNIYDVFKDKKEYDIQSKTTNYGIHRDDFLFLINNVPADSYASQGQVRNFILSVKLAVSQIIYEMTKNKPILIFDDVLSELDNERQNKLLNFLILNDMQVFISSTDIDFIDNKYLKNFQIIKLNSNIAEVLK